MSVANSTITRQPMSQAQHDRVTRIAKILAALNGHPVDVPTWTSIVQYVTHLPTTTGGINASTSTPA